MNVVLVALLAFERGRWNFSGMKEQAVHDTFGVSATRYYQALNAVIDMPEALAFDPMTINRLRRLREERRGRRTA